MGNSTVKRGVRLMSPRGSYLPNHLAVTCWCETEVVAVPERDVFEGRTGSCGRPGCHAPR